MVCEVVFVAELDAYKMFGQGRVMILVAADDSDVV
jgi:hypothetical protein